MTVPTVNNTTASVPLAPSPSRSAEPADGAAAAGQRPKLRPEQEIRASDVIARFTNGYIDERKAIEHLTAIGLSANEAAARLQHAVPHSKPSTGEIGEVPLPKDASPTPRLSVDALLTAQNARG
ncbi:MAG: hypothetical protein HYR63_11535 [Proteobacteria bacterium]|nr:hypothetical protein [Pseudomonadota bacterium]MBI3496349.1 hypothetical protein [Pseudomonadota bacterium]